MARSGIAIGPSVLDSETRCGMVTRPQTAMVGWIGGHRGVFDSTLMNALREVFGGVLTPSEERFRENLIQAHRILDDDCVSTSIEKRLSEKLIQAHCSNL